MCIVAIMTDSDGTTILSDATLALVEELQAVREESKKLEAREKEIRTVLLGELKDVEFGLTASGVPIVEVQRQPRSRIDSKRLQALYEKVWEDCQVRSTVEVIRFPETNTV